MGGGLVAFFTADGLTPKKYSVSSEPFAVLQTGVTHHSMAALDLRERNAAFGKHGTMRDTRNSGTT